MIEHIRRLQDFERLRDEWDHLAAPFKSPLLEHDWFLACAETLHREEDLSVVAVRQRGSLVAAAPLALIRASGQRLALLGANTLYEPSGLLFESDEALGELFAAVLAPGRPVVLQRISTESPACRMAPTVRHGGALTVVRPTAPSCAVRTDGSWDDYYGGLSRKIRQNLPRVRTRAERAIGGMRVEVLHPAPREVEDILQPLARIEGSGWKGRQHSSLAARPDLFQFFRRYAGLAASRGRLRVATLTFGGRVAAVELAVEAHDRVWQLKIGYEESLAEYYPGLLLTQASIQRAFEDRCVAYEFLGSAEPWEERWKPHHHAYCLLALYPLTARAMYGAWRDFAAGAARRVGRTLRRPASQ